MAMMLENQAAQLLREENTLSGGNALVGDQGAICGFSSVAFSIVRRVFGGLVANELVLIQPMSLPFGLLFYLDYTYGDNVGGASTAAKSTYTAGQSIYNTPVGKGIQSGSLATGGQYDLAGSGYTRVHSPTPLTPVVFHASGSYGNAGASLTEGQAATLSGSDGKAMQFDAQVTSLVQDLESATTGDGRFSFVVVNATSTSNADLSLIKDFGLYLTTGTTAGTSVTTHQYREVGDSIQGGAGLINVRRLNQLGSFSGGVFTPNPLEPLASAAIRMVVSGTHGAGSAMSMSYPIKSALDSDADGSTLTIPAFEHRGTTGGETPNIPEIDIKIESIAVTAVTRKLKAKWSPELA
jgi:hypothetical protein